MVILIAGIDEGICLLKISAFIVKHLAYYYLNNIDFFDWMVITTVLQYNMSSLTVMEFKTGMWIGLGTLCTAKFWNCYKEGA